MNLLCTILLVGQTLVATMNPQISVSINTVTPVSVTVTANPSPNARDFVGLYVPNTVAWNGFTDWFYLNGTKTRMKTGQAGGTVTFGGVKPGPWELRWYSLNAAGVATLLQSTSINVTLTPIKVNGVPTVVTRSASNNVDQIGITVNGQTGSIVAPPGSSVTVNGVVTP